MTHEFHGSKGFSGFLENRLRDGRSARKAVIAAHFSGDVQPPVPR